MLNPILDRLRRHRWLALSAFAIPFAGAAAFVMALPGLYRATATILVQRDVQKDAQQASMGLPAEVETRLQTIREEILSRQRLETLVDRFGLYPNLRHAPKEAMIDRMRRDIQIQVKGPESGAVTAAPPAGTIAFSLSFRSPDRMTTAAVANALAQSYVDENLRIRGQQARGTAEALMAQLNEVRAKLDEQEVRIGRYQAAHNGELPQQLAVNVARMQQLEMQLQLNRESRLRMMDRRDMVGAQTADPRYAELSGSPDAAAAKVARLKQELNDLQLTYNDNYPDVVRLKGQIASLEKQPKGAGVAAPPAPRPRTAGTGSSQTEALTLESEENRLRGEIETYRARVDRAPQREQEFNELSRDYGTTKDLYASLLKRYQEAKMAEDLERDTGSPKVEQLRILDTAVVPLGPFAPNRPRLLLFALVACIAFAAGAVLLAERLDTSFHTTDDLRSFTRVPVLVSIPPLSTSASRWRNRRRLAAHALMTIAGILLAGVATWSIAHGNLDLVQLLARSNAS